MLAPRGHLQHEERGSIQIIHHRHLLLHLLLWRLRAALREAASLPPSSPRGEHRLRCSPHTAQLVAEWPLLAKSRCTAFRGGRCAALALVVCPSASEPPGSVWRAVPTPAAPCQETLVRPWPFWLKPRVDCWLLEPRSRTDPHARCAEAPHPPTHAPVVRTHVRTSLWEANANLGSRSQRSTRALSQNG